MSLAGVEGGFTVGDILDIDGYDPDIWGVASKFAWFCLGHNFDVVGTILMMSNISWQRGFESGRAIKTITDTDLRVIRP